MTIRPYIEERSESVDAARPVTHGYHDSSVVSSLKHASGVISPLVILRQLC
jgi:hypothetical protein